MERKIPEQVKNTLRKEANFVCPIPGCCNPLLTWHHFDPPWAIEKHHRPEGMISLCMDHHKMADLGAFTIEDLHKFKKKPNTPKIIESTFHWNLHESIIRLAGNYSVESRFSLDLLGQNIFNINSDEDGKIKISFALLNTENKLIALMDRNKFQISHKDIEQFSISASSNRIKIFDTANKVGFELHHSRITLEQFEKKFNKDMGIKDGDITFQLNAIKHHGLLNNKVGQDGKVSFLDLSICNFNYKDLKVFLKNKKLQYQKGNEETYTAMTSSVFSRISIDYEKGVQIG
jgi:hypothetical protein